MDKTKGIMIGFAVLALLLLVFGTKKIKSIKGQIKEQTEKFEKLDERLNYLKNLEQSLERRRMEGQVLSRIPRVKDPVANKVLMEKFFKLLLSRMGFEAEVRVEKERASKDFPAVIGVNEVSLMIGVKRYTSYNQIMSMFDEFGSFPFGIEIFAIGGREIPVPGHLKFKLKYYIIPEGS